MTSTIKYLLFIFTCLLGLSFMHSDIKDELKFKLEKYYEENIPLQIHLFLNQPIYAPGDTIFFTGHLLTSHELRPIGGRQIIHLELINEYGTSVLHTKALAKDGRFHNQIILSSNLMAGNYTLLAYNNWMRNLGEDYYYKKTISIVSEFQFSTAADKTTWQFYPEGGQLLFEIATKVVVKGNANTSATIKNSSQEEIATLTTNEHGYSSIYLKAKKGDTYHLQVAGDNKVYKLPEAQAAGVAIQLLEGKERYDIILQTIDKSVTSKENLLLSISSHAELIYATDLNFQRQHSKIIRLAKKDLPDGLIQLSIFNEKRALISERLFHHLSDPVHPIIQTSKKVYTPREAVTLDIKIKDADGNPLPSEISVSVFKKELTPNKSFTNTLYDLQVYNNFPGNDIDISLIHQADDIDNYLITKQWNRFNWSDVWQEKKYNSHLFKSYLDVSAEIVELGTAKPRFDSLLVSIYLQKSQDIYEVYADKDGKFSAALLFDVWEEDEAFIMAYRKPNTYRNIKLKLYPMPEWNIVAAKSEMSKINDGYATYASKRKSIHSAYYFDEPLISAKSVSMPSSLDKIESAIKNYDMVINFSDYYIFPSMEETIREIIPWLQHRKINQKDIVKLYIKDLDKTGADEPLFIIDGIMTNRTDYFLNLNPADIISIKLINTLNKLEYFGVIGYNGIVVVETKIPEHKEKIARGENMIKIKGISSPLLSKSVNHTQNSNRRVPDLRANLCWIPSIITTENGEAGISFYTSDDTGSYIIVLQGFSKDGRPFFVEESFEVRSKLN
jgi:5-hydroxyisourate hydrolase-like protein (transthyretin family)